MEPKDGVVISIDRKKGEGCIRVPREFDHTFYLSDAPRRIKRDWSVTFLSVPGEAPDKPRAIQVRGVPKPTAA